MATIDEHEHASNDESSESFETDVEEDAPVRYTDLADWHAKTLVKFGIASSSITTPSGAQRAVRRDQIGRTLGGNLQSAFTKTRDGRTLVFAKPDQNPFLPPSPGDHGLLFTFNWRTEARTVSLFVRDSKDALWTYMGQYVKKAARELTREEWALQPNKVKQVRAKSVSIRKYAKDMTARIAKTTTKGISHTDIRAALDAGEERIQVVAMECVAYDASINRLLHGDPSSPASAISSKRTRSDSDAPAVQKRKAKKQRDHSSEDESVASDDVVSPSSRRAPRRATQRCVVYVDSSDSE